MDDSPPTSQPSALLDALTRLDEKLSRIEQRLERVERTAPELIGFAVDSFDDTARGLQARGVDLEQRVQNVLLTLERLTSHRTTHSLLRLLDMAEGAPDALATIVDTLDQHIAQLQEAGIDLDERLRVLARVVELLTTPAALGITETLLGHLPNIDRLLGSGVLSSGAIDAVSRASDALTEAQRSEARPVGAFGLLRALSDHDVQRALGFALLFARRLGRDLQSQPQTLSLPHDTQHA